MKKAIKAKKKKEHTKYKELTDQVDKCLVKADDDCGKHNLHEIKKIHNKIRVMKCEND